MENTCHDSECLIFQKLKLKDRRQCPNFVETGWKAHDKAEPKLIQDCAPKRTFFMIQELYNRLVGVEKSNEEQRNTGIQVVGTMEAIMNQIVGRLEPPKKNELGDIIDITPLEIG